MAYTFPPAPVGAIYMVRINMAWVDSKLMNTYYWRIETNPVSTTVKDVCDQMHAVFQGVGHLYLTHRALLDGSCQQTNVDIQQIAPTRFIPQSYVVNVFGDNVVTLDASNLAAVITRRGVNATRADVGSVHIPIPIDSVVFLNGDWTAGWKTKLTAHAGVMQAPLTLSGGVTMNPVIYHPTALPNYSYVGNAFYQSNVRVMRRRTKGIGI